MNKAHSTVAVITACLIILGATAAFATEEEKRLSADMSIDLLSQYICRGYEYSRGSIVIQPSITALYKGFGVNLWGNLDTDQSTGLYDVDGAKWNETDLTLFYDGKAGMMNYSAGYIYYVLEAPDHDTQEVYTSLGLDALLAPTLTVYRDIDAYPGWYVTLSVSHSFKVTESIALTLAGQVSYLSADEADNIADPDDPGSAYSDFHDGVISVALSIPVTEGVSIAPTVSYSFALNENASEVIKADSARGEDDSFMYGGVTLSMAL
jgi:hypothetical protein